MIKEFLQKNFASPNDRERGQSIFNKLYKENSLGYFDIEYFLNENEMSVIESSIDEIIKLSKHANCGFISPLLKLFPDGIEKYISEEEVKLLAKHYNRTQLNELLDINFKNKDDLRDFINILIDYESYHLIAQKGRGISSFMALSSLRFHAKKTNEKDGDKIIVLFRNYFKLCQMGNWDEKKLAKIIRKIEKNKSNPFWNLDNVIKLRQGGCRDWEIIPVMDVCDKQRIPLEEFINLANTKFSSGEKYGFGLLESDISNDGYERVKNYRIFSAAKEREGKNESLGD